MSPKTVLLSLGFGPWSLPATFPNCAVGQLLASTTTPALQPQHSSELSSSPPCPSLDFSSSPVIVLALQSWVKLLSMRPLQCRATSGCAEAPLGTATATLNLSRAPTNSTFTSALRTSKSVSSSLPNEQTGTLSMALPPLHYSFIP